MLMFPVVLYFQLREIPSVTRSGRLKEHYKRLDEAAASAAAAEAND